LLRITHIITGLYTGGAEIMLLRLLEHTDRTQFEPEVIALTGAGPVAEKIRALGVPVRIMGMRRGIPDPAGMLRLANILRRSRPDVVQTWLYHADLIGGLAARLEGIRAIAWGIHNTDLDPTRSKRTTIATARFCARLSRTVPRQIVCVAESGKAVHAALGYDVSRFVLIPNGFDTERFRPDPSARAAVRAEFGIPTETPLLGLLARFDPQKDHENFVAAAAILAALGSPAHFLLAGGEVTPENRDLTAWIAATGLQERFHLLGPRDDVPRLLAALDVCALSSRFGEAFPLVIGEAMACGVPCAATDVGDSRVLIGDTGRIVPPADPEALARACHELLTLSHTERDALSAAARARITANYEIGAIAGKYAALYEALANQASPPSRSR
jgi:glycosyltransferase involved in cell wall biosynthesis